ncbi:MAG: mycofactocin biosynthesis glycosyltransferase MftF [Actinomycetes bacterium]
MTKEMFPDEQWFRSPDGKTLLAGSPLTSFTVSEAGARILDVLENGQALPTKHEALTSRLLATGAVHPHTDHSVALSDITVVIPAYVTNELGLAQLNELITNLRGVAVIVVDDASPKTPAITGATVVRREHNGGPGAARNTGLVEVATPYVAFIDSDVIATPDDLQQLASILRDEYVHLVAPRITTTDDKSVIGEYESLRSPLDLGTSPAVVRPMTRVSYVPAAVLVARTEQLRHDGSFEESLRLGEDVDLVWRTVESGGVVRYVPSVECSHRPRRSWLALWTQRFGYGTSAAHLDVRHKYSASPLRAHAVLLLPALATLAGYIYFAALLALPTLLYFLITLRDTKMSTRTRAALTWIGYTSTLRLLATAVRRAWWPLFMIGMFFFPPALFMLLFAVLAPPAYAIVRQKPRHPVPYFCLRVLDDCAYGLGVWVGALRTRNFRCLLPVVTIRRTSRAK